MFERFNEQARQTVVLAQSEARDLKHEYIGPEHLLLGLLKDPDTDGAKVLARFGLTSESVRAELVELIGEGEGPAPARILFTASAKHSLELALRETIGIDRRQLGTGELLLGLMGGADGVAHKILDSAGATPEGVRELVLSHRVSNAEPGVVGERPVRLITRDANGNGRLRAGPDDQLRSLLTAAAEQALKDERHEFGLADLVAAAESLTGPAHAGGLDLE